VHRPAATEPNDRSKTSTVALPSARASVIRHNASHSVRAMTPIISGDTVVACNRLFLSRRFHVHPCLNDRSTDAMVLGTTPQCLLRGEKNR
jgi:hypothetical protein